MNCGWMSCEPLLIFYLMRLRIHLGGVGRHPWGQLARSNF